MYGTYLRRELVGRKKQTIIVATGLAIAIALVMIVNSLAAGVRDAQAQALESVYGVGTDLTVTGAMAEPGAGRRPAFEFGEDGGETDDDGTTSLSQSRLMTEPMRATLDAATLDTVTGVDGVAAASGALSLTNMTFSGELPQRPDAARPTRARTCQGGAAAGRRQAAASAAGRFDVDSFTRARHRSAREPRSGPCRPSTLSDGRALDADDAGAERRRARCDLRRRPPTSLSATRSTSAARRWRSSASWRRPRAMPTRPRTSTSRSMSRRPSPAPATCVSTVYVQADSVRRDRRGAGGRSRTALPDATVSSQSDLAATVSGSLSSASSLITNLGTWLSIIVLAVALALAVLFTISGVSRRTREFGTLKAIGWSNGRVVGQVAGESVVQGLIGGAAGLVLGFIGIWADQPHLADDLDRAVQAVTGRSRRRRPVGRPAGGGFGERSRSRARPTIVLHAPVTLWVVVAARRARPRSAASSPARSAAGAPPAEPRRSTAIGRVRQPCRPTRIAHPTPPHPTRQETTMTMIDIARPPHDARMPRPARSTGSPASPAPTARRTASSKALAGVDLEIAAGRLRDDPGSDRRRQVDAPAAARRARPAVDRLGRARRHRPRGGVATPSSGDVRAARSASCSRASTSSRPSPRRRTSTWRSSRSASPKAGARGARRRGARARRPRRSRRSPAG